MRPKCSICALARSGSADIPRVEAILAAGGRLKPVALKFGLSWCSLRRHWLGVSDGRKTHLRFGSRLAQESLTARAIDEKIAAIDHLVLARTTLHKSLMIAFSSGDHGLVVNIARAIAENVERGSRLSGDWPDNATPHNVTNIFSIGDVSQLLQVLRPFPEARAAIAEFYNAKAAPPLIEHHVAPTAD
jgi:hypothetical protein